MERGVWASFMAGQKFAAYWGIKQGVENGVEPGGKPTTINLLYGCLLIYSC